MMEKIIWSKKNPLAPGPPPEGQMAKNGSKWIKVDLERERLEILMRFLWQKRRKNVNTYYAKQNISKIANDPLGVKM